MSEAQITEVARRVEITEDGTVINIQLVRFRSAKGMKGELRFPIAATNDEIRAGVRTEAARLDELVGPV